MLMLLNQNPALDGGPLGWLNCNSTCTAMLVAFETANAKQPSGGDVRACTVNADGSKDVKGGTKATQNVQAAQDCWSVELDYRVMAFEDVWRLGQRADYAFSISISYAVISGSDLDGSPGFHGYHQVILHKGRVYDPLADGRISHGKRVPKGPQSWPKSLLMRAAGKYASTGEGRAAVIVGRAPTAKPKRYSVLFEPGAFFIYPVGAMSHSDADRDSFPTNTSAPCGAPFTIPWPGGRKRVVQITAGRLKGKRVEPTATHLRLKEAA